MEPILSRQEIADLLAAIKSGRVSLDLDGDEKIPQAPLEWSSCNLFEVSTKRIGQVRIPNFDIILDSFATNLQISLSNLLQRTFAITRTELTSASFQEYLLAKKNPGAIGVLNLSPLKYGALILLDPNLCFSLIEIMLGASPELDSVELDRKLTKLELNVLKPVIEKACEDIDNVFHPITKLASFLFKIENNPRLVSITEPDAEVIIGNFTISVGQTTSTLELVFPLATLEPFREEFKELVGVSSLRHGGWTDIITDQVYDIGMTIVAQSGVLDLSVGQLMDLKADDIITLDYDLNGPLRVLVEDRLKFFAIPGLHKGKKAISITSVSG